MPHIHFTFLHVSACCVGMCVCVLLCVGVNTAVCCCVLRCVGECWRVCWCVRRCVRRCCVLLCVFWCVCAFGACVCASRAPRNILTGGQVLPPGFASDLCIGHGVSGRGRLVSPGFLLPSEALCSSWLCFHDSSSAVVPQWPQQIHPKLCMAFLGGACLGGEGPPPHPRTAAHP